MEENKNALSRNDHANPDAADGLATSETKDGGSGSAFCSAIFAI